jgi:hypothetical protein
MTLASTHFGAVRTIYYCLDDTITQIMLILNAFIRIAYAVLVGSRLIFDDLLFTTLNNQPFFHQ